MADDLVQPAFAEAVGELLVLAVACDVQHVTFHGLRRTFASLHSYLGTPIRKTADMLGHEDVRFSMNVYGQSGLDPEEMLPKVRQAFRGLEWVGMGSRASLPAPTFDTRATKSPV